MRSITIVGPGRMGGALAIALSRCGHRIDCLIGRKTRSITKIARLIEPRPAVRLFNDAEPIKSGIIFIPTPDQEIADTAVRLKGLLVGKRKVVYHASGSLASGVLTPLVDSCTSIGSIHPLVSISAPASGADKFSGAYFCVEGDATAARVGMQVARRLGGKPFSLSSESKPLYHLAAVMAAGHVVALVDVAFSLMAQTGLGSRRARQVLLPLVASTLANLESQSTEDALTGPFARGDLSVVERHLNVLEKVGTKNDLNIYLDLALQSLDIAERRDGGRESKDLRQLILLAKQNFK